VFLATPLSIPYRRGRESVEGLLIQIRIDTAWEVMPQTNAAGPMLRRELPEPHQWSTVGPDESGAGAGVNAWNHSVLILVQIDTAL
jgi:hypothetical protein